MDASEPDYPLIISVYIFFFLFCILKRIRRHRNLIMIWVIPAMIMLVANSIANRHNHLISGVLYSHAHPFDRDTSEEPYQNHNHSNLELAILDLLTNLEVLSPFVLVYAIFRSILMGKSPVRVSYLHSLSQAIVFGPRAPPVYIF